MMLISLCLVASLLGVAPRVAEAFAMNPHSCSFATMVRTTTSSCGVRVHALVSSLQMSPQKEQGTGGSTSSSTSSTSSDVDRLRDSATRLRKEAAELEAKMAERRTESKNMSDDSSTSSTASAAAMASKKVYTALDDSEWTVSYRFASDPLPRDDDDNNKDANVSSSSSKRRNYSGKVGIKFRSDGYTDTIDTDQVRDIQYAKFWGWDEEISNEDELRYVLFSADVVLPESDNNAGTERFYFQARVEQDERTGEISLADGKVTVKRDIEPPGGFWGVFNGGGILAQFRACGDFVCRPR